MKITAHKIVTSLLLLLIFHAQAQWISSSEAAFANSTSIAYDQGTLYSPSLSQGVWKSTDEGSTWTQCSNNGLAIFSLQIKHISTANGQVYVGTPGGTFRSLDKGDNWTDVSQGLPTSIINTSKEVYYHDSVFFCLISGIYRSSTGDDWRTSEEGIPTNATVYHLSSRGSTLYASTNFGLFSSSDGGFNWSEINTPISGAITDMEVVGDRLVLMSSANGMYYSDDDGASWTQSNINSGVAILGDIVNNNGVLYAARRMTGLLISEDEGMTWQTFNTGLADSDTTGASMLAVGASRLFVATTAGHYYNDLNGGSGQAEITLTVDGTEVMDGDTVDYGDVLFGQSKTLSFTIKNDGTQDLQLTGQSGLVTVSSGWWPQFHIDESNLPTSISPGSSASFDITLTPLNDGHRYTDMSVLNNDLDESPFNLFLQANRVIDGLWETIYVPELTIYPNPVVDRKQISVMTSVGKGYIILQHAASEAYQIQNFDGMEAQIGINGPKGLYLCRLYNLNDELLQQSKLVVQ